MNTSEMFRIYRMGRQNKIAVAPAAANSVFRKLKVLVYYILVMILSPACKLDSEINYVNGEKKEYKDIENKPSQRIYRGYVYRNLHEFKEYRSFCTGISYFSRLRIIFQGIYLFFLNKYEDKDLASWVEFYIIYNFLKENNISKIVTRGHYDDVNTWLGEFSKCFGFSLVLFQHGIVLSNIQIPYKIFYSEVNVFDWYSKMVFEQNYVSNSNCKYSIYEYKASCEFEKISEKKSDIIYIGIGEQCNPEWVEYILKQVDEVFESDSYKCFIMLHPNSSYKYNGDNVVCTKEKYSNIDVLITDFSTLPLDYSRANHDVKVIYTRDVDCFQDYPFYCCKNSDLVKIELQNMKREKFI